MIEKRQIPKIKDKLSELMMLIRQTDASKVKKKNHEEFGMYDEGQSKVIWGEPYYSFKLEDNWNCPILFISNCKKKGV